MSPERAVRQAVMAFAADNEPCLDGKVPRAGYNLIVFMCCCVIHFKYGPMRVLDRRSGVKSEMKVLREEWATLQSLGWAHDLEQAGPRTHPLRPSFFMDRVRHE